MTELRNQKKAAYIKDKIEGMESLDAMKEVFPEASLGSTPDLRLNASVIPGIGFAPRAVGAIFGLQNSGELSDPIQEDIGVVIAKLNNITPAPENCRLYTLPKRNHKQYLPEDFLYDHDGHGRTCWRQRL
jgi:peptidyl-prolyl cis-trans isomerase D